MVAPPTLNRIALGEAVTDYLHTCRQQQSVGRLSRRTVANYTADMAELTRIIGPDTIVDDITGPDVDQALAAYADTPDQRHTRTPAAHGRSAASVERFRNSVSRFFSHAQLAGWVQLSPMPWSTLVPKPPDGLRLARTALTGAQALALVTHGPGTPTDRTRPHERNWARDRFILWTLTILGPRVSELAGANIDDMWPDTDTDGHTTWMWRILGKGNKVRTIPVSDQLIAYRDDYLAVRPRPSPTLDAAGAADAAKALVLTGRGTRMTPRDIERLLPRAQARVRVADPANAREVTPHALRHTAATLMLAAGWDVKLVAQMLGHASIATTGRYLDDIPGELAVAIAHHPLIRGD